MEIRRACPQAIAACAIIGLIAVMPSVAPAAGGNRIHAGAPVAVGKGSARVVVATNAAGEPASIAVILQAAALQGLPAGGKEGAIPEYVLPMPEDGPRTGYNHVGLNWEPAGHMPEGVYSVPHFDVHFYLVGAAERDLITFAGDRAGDAKTLPEASLLPKGYVAIPETAVERMGVHAVNPKWPEFRGKPFTQTFIYGYHKGRLVFLEPMVAAAFLESKPDVSVDVAAPSAYSSAAYYPARMRVGYDRERDQHTIALTRLKAWQGPATTAYLTPQAAPMAFQAAVKPLSE